MSTSAEAAGDEGSGSGVVRNTAVNAVGRVINAVLAVAITPVLLGRLGPAEYGVWVLATSLTFAGGFLSLAELGIQQASVRLIAAARAARDQAQVATVASTTTAIYAVLGVVLAVAVGSLARPLVHLFDVPLAFRADARLAFVLIAAQVALDLPAAGLNALLEGAQRYTLLRLVETGTRIGWAAASALAVRSGHGLVALGAISLASAGVGLLLTYVAVASSGLRRAVSPRAVRRDALRPLLRASGPLLGLRILGVVYNQMDRLIVGIALTTTAVATYDVSYKVHAVAAMMIGLTTSALVPAAAYLHAGADVARLRRLFVRGTRYAMAVAVPVAVTGMIYAPQILRSWVGDEYGRLAGTTRLFLAYPILAVALGVGQTILVGLGRMRRMVLLQALAVAVNLVVSIVLVPIVGVVGVVIGTLVGYLVQALPLARLYGREFEVGTARWILDGGAPTAVAVAAQVAFAVATSRWTSGLDRFWEVAILCGASYAVALAAVAAVIGGDERRGLLASVRRRGGAA